MLESGLELYVLLADLVRRTLEQTMCEDSDACFG